LLSIATAPDEPIVIKDSGYNADVNNITLRRSGSDLINGVDADYVISVQGGFLTLIKNLVTSDWEII
jgi:hypothetical protein